MKLRIVIIGAGITGLTLALKLQKHFDVTVYDKGRGLGGRMSTRKAEPFKFDHGAQFFTARGKAFQNFLEPLIKNGDVQHWQGKVITLEEGTKPTKRLWFEPHWVACPNMNSLCKKMAKEVTFHMKTEVAPVGEKRIDGWHLKDVNGDDLGTYDWVISTAPPLQTLAIFGG